MNRQLLTLVSERFIDFLEFKILIPHLVQWKPCLRRFLNVIKLGLILSTKWVIWMRMRRFRSLFIGSITKVCRRLIRTPRACYDGVFADLTIKLQAYKTSPPDEFEIGNYFLKSIHIHYCKLRLISLFTLNEVRPGFGRTGRREDSYLNDVDHQDFLKTLAEAGLKTGWQVHACCPIRMEIPEKIDGQLGGAIRGRYHQSTEWQKKEK